MNVSERNLQILLFVEIYLRRAVPVPKYRLLKQRYLCLLKSWEWFFVQSDQFGKISIRYKRTGNNMNVMRQTACLVVNPITVDNFAALFNCTPAGRSSDLMMAPA